MTKLIQVERLEYVDSISSFMEWPLSVMYSDYNTAPTVSYGTAGGYGYKDTGHGSGYADGEGYYHGFGNSMGNAELSGCAIDADGFWVHNDTDFGDDDA